MSRTNQTISKSDIAKQLAKLIFGDTSIKSQKKCIIILDSITAVITSNLIDRKDIKWQSLFTIKQYILPERKGRNPKTDEVVTFPEQRKIRFSTSKTLKKIVCGREDYNA